MRSRREDGRYEEKRFIPHRTNPADYKSGVSARTGRSMHKKRRTGIPGLLAVAAAVIVISGLMMADSFSSLAQSDSDVQNKYYKSITIENGDTLWDIAEEYITDDCDSIEEYISLLKDMNNLHGDKILSGDRLVIVYNASL